MRAFKTMIKTELKLSLRGMFMAILTIIAALFGLVLYRYTVLRYALICIGMIAGIKIALAALKKMKNN